MKTSFTIPVDIKLAERLRNATYWTPGLTIGAVVLECLEIAVDELERKNGGPFKQREGRIKAGRPPMMYNYEVD